MRYRKSLVTILEICITEVVDAPRMVPMETTVLAPENPDAGDRRRPDGRKPLSFRDTDFYMGQ
jgi:hypothetical protein